MISYIIDKYPVIIIKFSHSEWDKVAYETIITDLEAVLDFAISRNERGILFVQGNYELVGDKRPPVKIWAWICKDLLRLYSKIKLGINKTVIHKPTIDYDDFFKYLFKIYIPARPIHFYHNLEQCYAECGLNV